MSSAGLAERPERPALLTYSGRPKEGESMHAYQLPKGGAGIDALVKVERPDPKPAYRQVLVKVKACSLNFRDLGIVRGSYRMPVRENLIPLSDGAGEVVETGPGVSRVKVGDRVAGCFFQRWAGGEAPPDVHASALGGGIDGMLAEYAVLEEDGTVKIPEHLSLEEGATLPCAGVTVWHAMMEHAKLIAGQTVLLQGTGGVSIFASNWRARWALTRSSRHRATKSWRVPRRSAPFTASTT
jgi:NADPH:quinone reductase-like Zn-dependent oxidoreductase